MSSERDNKKPVMELGVKLHNRRVIGGLMKDGSIQFRLLRCQNRRIFEQVIRLSPEAIKAMGYIESVFKSMAKATQASQGAGDTVQTSTAIPSVES